MKIDSSDRYCGSKNIVIVAIIWQIQNIQKSFKKILISRTVFKTKRKNIDRYITFYFLLNLLWIVQVSIELCSS